MKKFVSALIAVLAVGSCLGAESVLSEARARFMEAEVEMQAGYRRDLSEALVLADRIEVFLLDFQMEEAGPRMEFDVDVTEGRRFPITPYSKETKILGSQILTDEQRAGFLPALQRVVGGGGR